MAIGHGQKQQHIFSYANWLIQGHGFCAECKLPTTGEDKAKVMPGRLYIHTKK
jgi:hypothetical protein